MSLGCNELAQDMPFNLRVDAPGNNFEVQVLPCRRFYVNCDKVASGIVGYMNEVISRH